MNRPLPLILLALSMMLYSANAQIQVTDLVVPDQNRSSGPRAFVSLNNLLLFTAATAGRGRELWVSDGTVDNTRLLKDINPGGGGGVSASFDENSVILGDKLFFPAFDSHYGSEIWGTNGTEEGTVRITDLPKTSIGKLTLVGNYFYFFITENDLFQLWKSDGTSAGTTMVKGGFSIHNSPTFKGTANNLFFFTMHDKNDPAPRVWRSDGTASGTFLITQPINGNRSTGNNAPTQYIEFNNNLYFVARSSSIFSVSTSDGIMKTDGTLENTVPVKAIHSSSHNIGYGDAIEINNKLYFSFYQDDLYRLFIWESDGTEAGTKKIYDEYGQKYYIPSNLSTNGVDLIFTGRSKNGETALIKLNLGDYQAEEIKELLTDAVDPHAYNYLSIGQIKQLADNSFYISLPPIFGKFEGWISDLTESNTILQEELQHVREIISYDDAIYFNGVTTQNGFELWKSDVVFDNPELFLDIDQSKYGLIYREFAVVEDKIFFPASDGIVGEELWAYNDSNSETFLVKDIRDGDKRSLPVNLTGYNEHVYFGAYTDDSGTELWRSDGTENGTIMISDMNKGPDSSWPENWVVSLGKLFFTALIDGQNFLCSTDGTEINIIKEIGKNGHNVELRIKEMVSSDNNLYFTVGFDGENLWKSDGTEAGTVKIKELRSISNLTLLDEKIFFSARETYSGEEELRRSDGTDTGTNMIKNIGNDHSSNPGDFQILNNQLIFTAYTPESGREYWTSDGTADGTLQIADINPGNEDSSIGTDYAELDNFLYFAATDGIHGLELWKTDGTPEGTESVRDINEGALGSFPKFFKSNGKVIYFNAYSAVSGEELWVTDGTTLNTRQLHDVFEGQIGSNPENLMFLNDDLFFVAETSNAGRQLWKSSASLVTGLDNFIWEGDFEIFPNPTSGFLNFNNNEFKARNVVIVNTQGQKMPINKIDNNKVYLGDLSPGVYIFIAQSDNKKIVKRFIKQ